MTSLRRIFLLMICSSLLFSCSACAWTSNGLMAGAAPETSLLSLYVYDGETACRAYVHKEARDVLNALDRVPATEAPNWSPADVTLPIYGLEVGAAEGSLLAAWSGGYWITPEGTAYQFDFDFEKLLQDYPWSDWDTLSSFAYIPCARSLAQDESGWNSTLLSPAPKREAPAGISMTLDAQGSDTVTVRFANASGAEWTYGEPFSLEALVGYVWYEVPARGNWGFFSIAYILPDGEAQDKDYSLELYGELPAGRYRLVTGGLSAEFAVDAQVPTVG